MERIVIIPALNPDNELYYLVDRNLQLENQVIIVNDGSDKSYEKMFWDLGEKCIVLRHLSNQGKGAAIKTALKFIKEEFLEKIFESFCRLDKARSHCSEGSGLGLAIVKRIVLDHHGIVYARNNDGLEICMEFPAA